MLRLLLPAYIRRAQRSRRKQNWSGNEVTPRRVEYQIQMVEGVKGKFPTPAIALSLAEAFKAPDVGDRYNDSGGKRYGGRYLPIFGYRWPKGIFVPRATVVGVTSIENTGIVLEAGMARRWTQIDRQS